MLYTSGLVVPPVSECPSGFDFEDFERLRHFEQLASHLAGTSVSLTAH